MFFGISFPILIMIVIGALIILSVGYNFIADKKRRDAIQQVAEEMGLAFYADGDPGLLQQLSDLPVFSKGRSRRINNMIHGETDAVVMGIFDYRYTTGSGKNSRTYRQSIAFFRSNDLNLPTFELSPQSFFHGIGKIFGYQDIDFDTHPTFSKAFLLRGANEKHVRATFDATLLTALERKQGVCVEGQHHDLVFYRRSKRVKPAQLRELMNEGFQVFTMFRGNE